MVYIETHKLYIVELLQFILYVNIFLDEWWQYEFEMQDLVYRCSFSNLSLVSMDIYKLNFMTHSVKFKSPLTINRLT